MHTKIGQTFPTETNGNSTKPLLCGGLKSSDLRIGNLVLISRRKNSSQGNKEYADKKNKYFKSNIELFSNSVRIYNQFATWTFED